MINYINIGSQEAGIQQCNDTEVESLFKLFLCSKRICIFCLIMQSILVSSSRAASASATVLLKIPHVLDLSTGQCLLISQCCSLWSSRLSQRNGLCVCRVLNNRHMSALEHRGDLKLLQSPNTWIGMPTPVQICTYFRGRVRFCDAATNARTPNAIIIFAVLLNQCSRKTTHAQPPTSAAPGYPPAMAVLPSSTH